MILIHIYIYSLFISCLIAKHSLKLFGHQDNSNEIRTYKKIFKEINKFQRNYFLVDWFINDKKINGIGGKI